MERAVNGPTVRNDYPFVAALEEPAIKLMVGEDSEVLIQRPERIGDRLSHHQAATANRDLLQIDKRSEPCVLGAVVGYKRVLLPLVARPHREVVVPVPRQAPYAINLWVVVQEINLVGQLELVQNLVRSQDRKSTRLN